MNKKAKDFLVSTADFAFYYNDVLACTGVTNLNASLEVSMEEQDVNAGKGNKLVYSYKYGRQLNVTLEAADWRLEYLAMAVGSKIAEGLTDVYMINECVVLNEGIGVLGKTPIGDVGIELPNGEYVTVTSEGTTVDLTSFGLTGANDSVKATYRYSRLAKSIPVDADAYPLVGTLVLDADKCNNKVGKVGSVQIIVPSYQLSGNFTIEMTPDGAASTSLEGKALAVEGDTCAEGNVYAYIKDFEDIEATEIILSEIAATPETINLDSAHTEETATISVVGIKGSMYDNIELDNADCEFVSEPTTIATVDGDGVVTAVATGSATITVSYGDLKDTVNVEVA